MYAVLKQSIISTDGFHCLAEKGRVYRLGDIVAVLALSDITDAGADLTICKAWVDAVTAYRVMHMERDNLWEGDDRFPWNPAIAIAHLVGEVAARDAALSEA